MGGVGKMAFDDKGTGYSERPGKVMMDLCGSDTSRCSNRLKSGP